MEQQEDYRIRKQPEAHLHQSQVETDMEKNHFWFQGPSGISELEIISSRNIEASFPLKKQAEMAESSINESLDQFCRKNRRQGR